MVAHFAANVLRPDRRFECFNLLGSQLLISEMVWDAVHRDDALTEAIPMGQVQVRVRDVDSGLSGSLKRFAFKVPSAATIPVTKQRAT